jgi:hypothetical protein
MSSYELLNRLKRSGNVPQSTGIERPDSIQRSHTECTTVSKRGEPRREVIAHSNGPNEETQFGFRTSREAIH